MKYYKLDRDTKAYLKRMAVDGIKTPADIYSVNDFIVGLKDYNIWGDVLDGWVMRSTQNAGTGSRVYSLKDNRYNGTLENGGTWTANGIYLRGDNLNPSQKIRLFTYRNFPNKQGQYGIPLCGVVQPMNWSTNAALALLSSDSFYSNPTFYTTTYLWGGTTSNVQMAGINFDGTNFKGTHTPQSLTSTKNAFNFIAYAPSGPESIINSTLGGVNRASEGTQLNYGTPIGFDFSLYIGPFNSQSANGMFNFIMYFNNVVTSAQMLQIYSLAKNTISKGLGLP
jgi:hypothetical protein